MAATADVAGEKVSDARKRLAAALERAKEIGGRVRDKAVAGAKVADQAIRENPYQAIAIGVGVGALIGYLLAPPLLPQPRLIRSWKTPPSACGNWLRPRNVLRAGC